MLQKHHSTKSRPLLFYHRMPSPLLSVRHGIKNSFFIIIHGFSVKKSINIYPHVQRRANKNYGLENSDVVHSTEA